MFGKFLRQSIPSHEVILAHTYNVSLQTIHGLHLVKDGIVVELPVQGS